MTIKGNNSKRYQLLHSKDFYIRRIERAKVGKQERFEQQRRQLCVSKNDKPGCASKELMTTKR
jgi:hypothetical protein